MKLGMRVGLGPGHIVLDGDPAPLPQKGQSPPIFSSYLLWPNGRMDEDASWREVGLRPSDIVLDGYPAPLPKKPQKGSRAPQFVAHVYCGHNRPFQLLLSSCLVVHHVST